ncbi:uncharacterized protein LOC117115493 [Anneissia japonica]|uniref:uncharacterized protein LOC117115493 n=1 Tax=Anneissia japonica TaxID=1529436 RepID=UPI001425B952|nr:uncharacterized protein LOC117115493 [Anneissia japonica]
MISTRRPISRRQLFFKLYKDIQDFEKASCFHLRRGKPTPEPVEKLKGGVIAGIVIGCIAGLCLILLALLFAWKKSKSPSAPKSSATKKSGGKTLYNPVTEEIKTDADADEVEEKPEDNDSENPKSTDTKAWV